MFGRLVRVIGYRPASLALAVTTPQADRRGGFRLAADGSVRLNQDGSHRLL